jgi:predicted nucleotidyltransferase
VTGDDHPFGPISQTLRSAAATLREAGIPFLLGGSLAFWARGGKETANDLDLVVKPQDAEAALAALGEAGMRTERPPENWLLKAYDREVLVDIIFAPSGLEITDEVIARGEEVEVAAVRMRVMALEDALLTKLFALGEHQLDYEPLLQTARSLREKIDWAQLCDRSRGNPYAEAFFFLLERLDIVEACDLRTEPSPVRELEPQSQRDPVLGPAPGAPR